MDTAVSLSGPEQPGRPSYGTHRREFTYSKQIGKTYGDRSTVRELVRREERACLGEGPPVSAKDLVAMARV